MKKILVTFICLILFLTACSNQDKDSHSNKTETKNKKEMQTFTMDNGKKVKVPKHSKRIVVLHPTLVGALVKFNHKPIAVPEFINQNKTLNDVTKGIKRIDSKSIEQVAKQKPDLILTTTEDKNIKKLQKIAPTVSFNMTKSTYKDTTRKLGQLINEDKKANQWIKNWDSRLAKDKKDLSPFIKGKTATVIQQTPKGTMAFSDHMGRGTEIIYDGYGFKQPKSLKHALGKQFATPISQENFKSYIGDIVVVAEKGGQTSQFEQTNFWNNLPAVKHHHVIKFDVTDTQYNDPISLEKQRDIFYKALKKMKDNNK